MQIRTKSEFYDLWHKGVLGNRPRTWTSLLSLQDSGYRGLVTLRHRGHAGGGMAVTHVPAHGVEAMLSAWTEKGIDAELVEYNESMPDEQLLIQGEVTRTSRGLELTYSTEPGLSMRAAMQHPRTTSGLTAKLLLDRFMDANSRDDLESLLEMYPDAAIEFGTYAIAVGVLPRRNTIIWEVRNY